MRNESPVQVRCRIQEAWGWCTGMTQRDGMGREVEGGSGWGTRVHPWWMHVDVWQNQYNVVKKKTNKKTTKHSCCLSLGLSSTIITFHHTLNQA